VSEVFDYRLSEHCDELVQVAGYMVLRGNSRRQPWRVGWTARDVGGTPSSLEKLHPSENNKVFDSR
jgi:hypothetical protein